MDGESGLMLASEGGGQLDLNMVAALNTDFLGLQAQDITQKTQSQDFARNRQIHNCWLITHAGKE